MKKFKKSLVVGKFCPLHNGHIFTIRTALEESEEVIILSYTSEDYENCSGINRKLWFDTIFEEELKSGQLKVFIWENGSDVLPSDDDPAYDHRLFCAQYLESENIRLDAIFGSEDYIKGFAEFMTQYQMSQVEGVIVDSERSKYKISGTALRNDHSLLKFFTDSCVQQSFVPTVLILGGESSGKTTLAKNLAGILDTEWVPEFGREFYDLVGGELEFSDMEMIATEQLTREYYAEMRTVQSGSGKPIIYDTSPLTTLFYSLHLFDNVSERLTGFARNRKYSHVFLCAPDFPFVQDGTRQDDAFRRFGHRFYVSFLNGEGIPYTLLHGSLYDRLGQALKVLKDKKIVL